MAAQVDFMGPGTIMPDFGHGVIYFKRFNTTTGNAEFYAFAVQPPPQPAAPPAAEPASYDPREDIEGLRGEYASLRAELDELKKAGQKRPSGKAAE